MRSLSRGLTEAMIELRGDRQRIRGIGLMVEWTVASVDQALRQQSTVAPADWRAMLNPLDADIVRLRSGGARWKPICWQLGIGRATAHRRFKAALKRIAEYLNRTGRSDTA
jgi:hypothetical protein